MRRTDNYAFNQIRIFLVDLNTATHADKKKAIKNFEVYVDTYHPEVSAENVDYLFTGCHNGTSGQGLLHWSGAMADNHKGELKRICRPALGLLRWLVTHDSESEEGNMFYARFVALPLDDLRQLNFSMHIAQGRLKKKKRAQGNENEHIFVLLTVLLADHRTEKGLPRVDASHFLCDEECHKKYTDWTDTSEFEAQAREEKGLEGNDRPLTWEEVLFKTVPLQEGEEDSAQVDEEPQLIPPVVDPLGISQADLRSIQASYAQGRLMKSSNGALARRATRGLVPMTGSAKRQSVSGKRQSIFTPFNRTDSSDDDDEDSEEESSPSGKDSSKGARFRPESEKGSVSPTALVKRTVASVVPSDKNFSTLLFLTLVHGSISFFQLKSGLDHLQQHLNMQSSRRENLVRAHFGLFVQCAEGLEFLKAYRKGVLNGHELRRRKGSAFRKSTEEEDKKDRRRAGQGTVFSSGGVDKGLERLKKSQTTLDMAKAEAQRTLAPILERMKQSRKIRSAEKVPPSLRPR